ncbi:hypothetical protein BC835DRAFT_1350044 [Cytidiella melzeri]|nr:hypothetical protein BC835DRAFT_1350026 [Cytidiella melzeri]KAI0694359.1 hypothetical protein BC835DRAFT_1350044 [Cytidiella melzeri]
MYLAISLLRYICYVSFPILVLHIPIANHAHGFGLDSHTIPPLFDARSSPIVIIVSIVFHCIQVMVKVIH